MKGGRKRREEEMMEKEWIRGERYGKDTTKAYFSVYI